MSGLDASTKTPGRKRGLAVDVLGLVNGVVVLAASAHDNAAGTALLDMAAERCGMRLEKALVDQGFKDEVCGLPDLARAAQRVVLAVSTRVGGCPSEGRATTDPTCATVRSGRRRPSRSPVGRVLPDGHDRRTELAARRSRDRVVGLGASVSAPPYPAWR